MAETDRIAVKSCEVRLYPSPRLTSERSSLVVAWWKKSVCYFLHLIVLSYFFSLRWFRVREYAPQEFHRLYRAEEGRDLMRNDKDRWNIVAGCSGGVIYALTRGYESASCITPVLQRVTRDHAHRVRTHSSLRSVTGKLRTRHSHSNTTAPSVLIEA